MTVGELRKVITGLPDNCTAFMVVNGMALDIDICTIDQELNVVWIENTEREWIVNHTCRREPR